MSFLASLHLDKKIDEYLCPKKQLTQDVQENRGSTKNGRKNNGRDERWGAGVETPKNVRGEFGGWGRVPFNEPYAPSLSTIYDGA